VSVRNSVNNALKWLGTYLIISVFVPSFTDWCVVLRVKYTWCVLLRTSCCECSAVSYYASKSEYWQMTVLLITLKHCLGTGFVSHAFCSYITSMIHTFSILAELNFHVMQWDAVNWI